MQVIGDRGIVLSARITRREGRITQIRAGQPSRLRRGGNGRLVGPMEDAEGLARAPGGGFYVSFEFTHRIGHYARPGAKATILPAPPNHRTYRDNGALEALAVDARGHVYTLPERPRGRGKALPVYRWDGQSWSQPFALPRRGPFVPVGADFGPDGQFYLLERGFSPLGFRTRVRRWDITGDRPAQEITLLQTRTGEHDNLEGLSVWRDPTGRIRLTMISDDNFLPVQRTELVEYAIPLALDAATQ